MDLTQITPLILTKNEEANIADTLKRLQWAERCVVVDSFSDDRTVQIAKNFSNVDVIQREFDDFASQCNFGLTQIHTEWVLSLDADYRCPMSLEREIEKLDGQADGFELEFRYCIHGKPLGGSLYPPRKSLYRKSKAIYEADGHAHRLKIDGDVQRMNSRLLHDDRKPLSVWMEAQTKYAKAEADKLLSSERLDWKDRLRCQIIFAPMLTLFYCLFYKRLIFDGRAGLFYTLQRVYAELALALELLDRRLRLDATQSTGSKLGAGKRKNHVATPSRKARWNESRSKQHV